MNRATSFGGDAALYDRARPGYPPDLVDRLLADGARVVLDIGCGTGKAARCFSERGCEVLGVDADERMAAVARGHGIVVEVARFEDWDPRGRSFDLAVCGQAWHWFAPETALPKIVAVLRIGGRFAAFWNIAQHDDAFLAAIRPAYERLAPHIASRLVAEPSESPEEGLEQLAAAGLGRTEHWTFRHTRTYRRDEWLDLLRTQSDHILLPPTAREALLATVGAAIDAREGRLAVDYRTAAITGVRIS